MAWPDGSRFLVANGVKWGTGPKFYYGPSHDTPWNHDLNWSHHVSHVRDMEDKADNRRFVLTPAPEHSMSNLMHPGQPIYRPLTSRDAAVPPSPTSLSEAGKRLLSGDAERKSGRGSSSASRSLRGSTSASQLSGVSSGSRRELSEEARRELSMLKTTLMKQTEHQRKTEEMMQKLAQEIESLKTASPGKKQHK